MAEVKKDQTHIFLSPSFCTREDGQPNCLSNQYCIQFHMDTAGLNDMECTGEVPYICEVCIFKIESQ